jgi:hypothetical protein
MYQALFRSWKIAALWALGVSAGVAAFFADDGGQEQLERNTELIREGRAGGPVEPASGAAETAEAEADEAAFGEPMLIPSAEETAKVPAPLPGVSSDASPSEEAEFQTGSDFD